MHLYHYRISEQVNQMSAVWQGGPVSRPVALTHAAWCDCVAWTEQNNRFQVHHDESGRLWDVLFMAFYVIRASKDSGDRL